MQRHKNVNTFILFPSFCLFSTFSTSKNNVPNKLINKKNQLSLLSQIHRSIKKFLVLRLNFLLQFIKILWFINYFCATISGEINNSFEVTARQNNNVIIRLSNLTTKNGFERNKTHNISFKVLSHHLKRQQQISSESELNDEFNELPITLKSDDLLLLTPTSTKSTVFTSPKIDGKRKKNFMKKERIARQSNMPKNFKTQNKKNDENLEDLYNNLEILKPCNRTIDTPLVRRLLNDSINLSIYSQLLKINPSLDYPINMVIRNSSITNNPIAFPPNNSAPIYVLKLLCKPTHKWTPVIVYPTQTPNSFLQIQISDFSKLNACSLTMCNSKCSYTVHYNLKIYARSCCLDHREFNTNGNLNKLNNDHRFCRDDRRQMKRIFYALSIFLSLGSIVTIPLVIRERMRPQQEARGWALMEPFFLGAAFLYIIPLLDWYNAEQNSCFIAVWLRIIGFTFFYGSILLKIFKNLQEYRVRKAHHVVVREQDLLKYLFISICVSCLALLVWTISSSKNIDLWQSSWPQCPMEATAQMWIAFELLVLFYGIRLCYKARSSSWSERYHFSLAIVLEATVVIAANLIKYSFRNVGSNDLLFIIIVIQTHFPVSANIIAIILPKFITSTESSRRSLAMSGSSGNSGRAHPSLAKLRDNLVNGTIDFADIPITEMNAEDIRAELKRVYTQLRMYKLKNIYQDNPHISKRKGGGKKLIDKSSSKNRRISIPPPLSNGSSNSPKNRRLDELANSVDDEKNDLTVESAPHNIFLSTSNKVRFLDAPIVNDQSLSVRV